MSALDKAVGFSLLVDFLDNGAWGDTSLTALRMRSETIRSATDIDLGELYLYQPDRIPPASSSWDASDWGTYTSK
jgi:hypothetical protein